MNQLQRYIGGSCIVLLAFAGIAGVRAQETRHSPAARLYFDRAHGELPAPAGMAKLAETLGVEIFSGDHPLSDDGLKGSRVLYLRAPSKTFTEKEKQVVADFVRNGASLLLVLDEEKRQSLATTGVNDLIAPFGMHLTPDTNYVPNPGAIAIAGEINKENREIPYDGGRAVDGGTPFAYQIDEQGKPSQPYGAWKKVEGGGRVVVLAEGMASLFMGSPEGRRLTPVTGNSDSVYFGKDSAIFMQEIISWLLKSDR